MSGEHNHPELATDEDVVNLANSLASQIARIDQLVSRVDALESEPEPEPEPEPVPEPPPGNLLLDMDPDSGKPGGGWDYLHSAVPVGIEVAPDGVISFRTEIQDGKLIYGTERSEWANGPDDSNQYRAKQGDETWTSMSVYFDRDYPVPSSWALIEQWKVPHEGTPPQQISIAGNRLSIIGVGSEKPRKTLPFGLVNRGKRTNIVVGHGWHSDPSRGWVEVWVNGAKALNRTTLKTLEQSNDEVFWSVGQYRDTSNSGRAVLWIGRVKVGRNRSDVM